MPLPRGATAATTSTILKEAEIPAVQAHKQTAINAENFNTARTHKKAKTEEKEPISCGEGSSCIEGPHNKEKDGPTDWRAGCLVQSIDDHAESSTQHPRPPKRIRPRCPIICEFCIHDRCLDTEGHHGRHDCGCSVVGDHHKTASLSGIATNNRSPNKQCRSARLV